MEAQEWAPVTTDNQVRRLQYSGIHIDSEDIIISENLRVLGSDSIQRQSIDSRPSSHAGHPSPPISVFSNLVGVARLLVITPTFYCALAGAHAHKARTPNASPKIQLGHDLARDAADLTNATTAHFIFAGHIYWYVLFKPSFMT